MTVDIEQLSSMPRRFLAISYDLILLISVLFIATLIILPITGGTAINSGNLFYTAYLLLFSYLYFAWQWVHGGRTLGMQAWKIHLIGFDGKPVGWNKATQRYLLALISCLFFGAGFIWAFIDREKLTLHDRFSRTFVKGPTV